MCKLALAAALFSIAGATGVYADCSNILAQSRLSSAVLLNKSDFEKTAKSFCNQNLTASGGSSSGTLGIPGLIQLGGSINSATSAFAKYCQSNNDEILSNFIYRSYVDAVAPGAYEAYSVCERSTEVVFELLALQKQIFSMLISYKSGSQNPSVAIDYVISGSGVSCNWRSQVATPDLSTGPLTIKHAHTDVLQCIRQVYDQGTPITIFRTDAARGEYLTIPWPGYTEDGLPIDTAKQLQATVASISQRLSGVQSDLSDKTVQLAAKLATYGSLKGTRSKKVPNASAVDCEVGQVITGVTVFQEWTEVRCGEL